MLPAGMCHVSIRSQHKSRSWEGASHLPTFLQLSARMRVKRGKKRQASSEMELLYFQNGSLRTN